MSLITSTPALYTNRAEDPCLCSSVGTCATYDAANSTVYGCVTSDQPSTTTTVTDDSTTWTDSAPLSYPKLYTSCHPYVSTSNCGLSCSYGSLDLLCPHNGINLRWPIDACLTAFLIANSTTYTSFSCVTAATATTIIVPSLAQALPSASLQVASPTTVLASDSEVTAPGLSDAAVIGIIVAAVVVTMFITLAAYFLFHPRIRRYRPIQTSTSKAVMQVQSLPTSAKLGTIGIITIILPVIFVALVLVFLALFWPLPTYVRSTVLRRWVLEGNLTRIITVLSLFIRTLLSFQSMLAGSMLAAIALERLGLRLREFPRWLIQRGGGVSLFPMAYMAFQHTKYSRNGQSWMIMTCAGLLCILSTALQFISTILLSDLHNTYRDSMQSMNRTSIAYTFYHYVNHRDYVASSFSYFKSVPTAYAAFAEYAEEPESLPDDVDYTGLLLRGILPFSQQTDREMLHTYEGDAIVFNATSLCTAPTITDLQWSFAGDGINGTGDYPAMADQLAKSGNSLYDWFVREGVVIKLLQFSCPFSWGGEVPRDWWLQICGLSGENSFAFLNFSVPQVLLDTFGDDLYESTPPKLFSSFSSHQDGPWSIFSSDTYPDLNVSITFCSISGSALPQDIVIDSAQPLAEKYVTASPNMINPNTSSLVSWLGVTRGSRDTTDEAAKIERSIMNMKSRGGSGWQVPIFSTSQFGAYVPQTEGLLYEAFDALSSKELVFASWYGPVHPSYCELAQSILQSDRNRPAQALQALSTMVFLSWYYDHLFYFDIFSNATTSRWVQVLAPTTCQGFITVCVIILCHFIIVVVILRVFLRQTKYSKLQDAWQVFTQTNHGELAQLLEKIDCRPDEDMDEFLEHEEKGLESVQLAPSLTQGSGVCVRRHEVKGLKHKK